MDVNAVTEALKKLTQHNASSSDSESSSDDNEEIEYFCVEDIFISTNLCVTVDGIGKLDYPLTKNVIDDLIKLSCQAKFGRGEETVLDRDVRDTQMIPANKLNVEINKQCLANALERIGSGLNIDKFSKLVPYLHNMLIYGPGQFFKMHRDSEKMKNMVATLVILLPCAHKGGDLIVKHNGKTHVFFGTQNFEFIKCVVFYSDCEHEVKKVTEGYRVALTYNVVMEFPEIVYKNVDNNLDTAVNQYFSNINQPNKLVFLLNHSYSEYSLKWGLLKGTDRTHAHALYAVAKKQGRIPCLALAEYNETFDVYDESEVLCSNTQLYHWIDDTNSKFLEESCFLKREEICCTIKTAELFEPYKTEESGPTGNEGETRDHWYRRACVVIWSNKWVFSNGFKQELRNLHNLTDIAGNERYILDCITEVKSCFYKKRFWQGEEVINKLLDIAIYLHDPETAVDILSNLSGKVLEMEHIDHFIVLNTMYNDDVWEKVIISWKTSYFWSKIMENTITFIKLYIETSNYVSNLVISLLKESVEHFIMNNNTVHAQPIYRFSTIFPRESKTNKDKCRTDKTTFDNLSTLLQNCANLNQKCLEKTVFDYILATPSVYPAVSVAELFFKMQSLLKPNQFLSYKLFRESVLNVVNNKISEITNYPNDWSLSITLPCQCKFCTPVQIFFNSKIAKKVVVLASKVNRRHVYSYLNPLIDQPIKFYTERTGCPFKIIIEKEPNMLEERKKLFNDLLQLEKRLKEVIFMESSTLNNLEESSNVVIQAVNSVSEPVEQSQNRTESPINLDLSVEMPIKRQKLGEDPRNY